MYKRVTAIILSISLLTGLLRINAQAIESIDIDDSEIELECNTDMEYDAASEPQEGLVISSSGKTVSGYTGSASKVIIPEGVEYISKDAFLENSVIKEVSIPSTIEKLVRVLLETVNCLRQYL